MEPLDDEREPGGRSTEQVLRDAFAFHETHAAALEYRDHVGAAPVRARQRWWPVLAAAVVAAVVGGIVFVIQANRPGPPVTGKAPDAPFVVVTGQLERSSCSDAAMTPAVVIPGGTMPGSRLEAGMVGGQLCIGALGDSPRGWVTLDRRPGALAYFTTVGFSADSNPAGSAVNADWFALGAVDPSIDTIRYLPQAGGQPQNITQVAALGGLRVFSFPYDAAGTLEFISRGSVVDSEALPDQGTQPTGTPSTLAAADRPCANQTRWENRVDVAVRDGVAGDGATAAHDTTTVMGRDLVCVHLETEGRSVDLSADPGTTGSVYQLFTTYQLGDSRFLIGRFTAVVTGLSVTVGTGAPLTFGPDDLRPDAMGFIAVVARIPAVGELTVKATDARGQLIIGALPTTRLEGVDGS